MLASDEWRDFLIVSSCEISARLDKLIDAFGTDISQRLRVKDAKPDLQLIEPPRAGACEVRLAAG